MIYSGPLAPAELQSLRELTNGAKPFTIPAAHIARLLQFGYLKEGIGGLKITETGHIRVALSGE
jgi:hypothetical protein